MNGTGTPVNYALATYYFSQAVPQNYSRTFVRLITDSIADSPYVKYLRGRKAYSRHDFDQAMELFKEVERTNRAEGQLMQGVILANSNYSRHNLDKGIKLIRKAAESDPQAMYILASLHEQGRGVDQNMPRTVELYTASADAGYGPAMCALADMYFRKVRRRRPGLHVSGKILHRSPRQRPADTFGSPPPGRLPPAWLGWPAA